MAKYKVLGLPTILFFNRDGKEIEGSRVNGFMPPVEFYNGLRKSVKHKIISLIVKVLSI